MNRDSSKPRLTPSVNRLTDHFHSLNLKAAPLVEPAILAPFWAPGDFINVSGPPGCGKTRLAADIVIAAIYPHRDGRALGGLVKFDRGLLDGRNIAILDAENDQARWQTLVRQKLEREGVTDFSGQERIVHIRACDIGIQRQARWRAVSKDLAAALALNRVGFVVGDTLARIWAPEEINSAAWVQSGYASFREACRQYGITGLMLTHTKRQLNAKDPPPEAPIGSSFQEGQADGQVMISRTTIDGRPGIKLTHRKSRRSPWIQQNTSVALKFTNSLGYEVVGEWRDTWPHECPDYDAEEGKFETATSDKISALLKAQPSKEWSTAEIADELGRRERTIRHHLQALERAGWARKVSNGPSTRWRAAI